MNAEDVTPAHLAMQLFPGYVDADTTIFSEFANPAASPEPGFLVDFLGSRIRTTSVWKEARALEGQLLGLPLPGDFHAEAIEWIGLLKAVRDASGQYVAMELGAGFGPWSVAGGKAAMLRGIQNIRLCAVEGDSDHFQFLLQHFTDNGFDPSQHSLLEAAVGTQSGVTQWPVNEGLSASESWGARPIRDSEDHLALGDGSQKTRSVNVISMRDLVVKEPCWDLIHIDVQGDEVAICRSCIDELNARVRWIIVGTHSRKLDGDFLDLMWQAGWLLEHEKPAKFAFLPAAASLEAMTTMDGTQVWRNPGLTRQSESLGPFSQEITCSINEFRIRTGARYTLPINVKNTSTRPWFGFGHTASVAAGYRWIDSLGQILPLEGERSQLSRGVVRSGESDALVLQIVGPTIPGLYTLWISMVQEGVSWFFDRGADPLTLRVMVEP